MGSWAVLLADPAGIEPGVLGKFLAAERKVPLIDAQRIARHAWGFLGQGLTEPEAQALEHAAVAAGLPVKAVEEKTLAILPEPSSAHGATFAGDRLNILVGVPSTPRPLPLSQLNVLAIASLRRDTLVTKTVREEASGGRKLVGLGILLTTGIPTGMSKSKDVQQTVAGSEWVMFLDILGDGGRWRVVPSAFDFSGLGHEKAAGGAENLRHLLVLLHRLAPQALLNRGARWWLEGRPLGTVGYDDLADVNKETRWLMTLAGMTP